MKNSAVMSSTINTVFKKANLPNMPCRYGFKTWTLMIGLIHKFKETQREMNKVILGFFL